MNTTVSEIPVAEAQAAEQAETPAAQPNVNVDSLASIVADMNLFLARLGTVPPFSTGKLGLAEWLVLGALDRSGEMLPKQLSKSFGIAPSRISALLDKMGKAEIVAWPGENGEPATLTDQGRTQLAEANESLHSALLASMDDPTKAAILALQRRLKWVSRKVNATISRPKNG